MMQRGNSLRPVAWIRKAEFDLAVDSTAPASFVLVSSLDFDEFTRPTVVRVRLALVARIIDITLGQQAVVNMGVTLVNPNEPVPDAAGEVDGNRWLWWHQTRLENLDASVVFIDGVSWRTIDVDIRSMRKRGIEGSSLQLAIRVRGAGVVGFDLGSSTLVKE